MLYISDGMEAELIGIAKSCEILPLPLLFTTVHFSHPLPATFLGTFPIAESKIAISSRTHVNASAGDELDYSSIVLGMERTAKRVQIDCKAILDLSGLLFLRHLFGFPTPPFFMNIFVLSMIRNVRSQ